MNDQAIVYEPARQVAMQPSAEMTAMHFIDRVLRDTSIPMERLREAFDLRRELKAEYARNAYDAAFADMQPKLPTIDRNGKIEIRAKDNKTGERTGAIQQSSAFADWADINEAIRPILGEHGFGLSFRTGQTPQGRIEVKCILSHRDGHREETSFSGEYDTTGSKNNMQAGGSSLSYLKRYTACAILNITSRAKVDRDDDGVAGGAPAATDITSDQVANLMRIVREVGADGPKMLRLMSRIAKRPDSEPFASFADIPPHLYETAVALLEQKRVTR